MKKIATVILCMILLIALVGCNFQYDENKFIGKTSAEIVNEFGSFDCIKMPASEDGLYRNCQCGYTIKEAQNGFFGKSSEILFFITFDENGIAIACEKNYRPGG